RRVGRQGRGECLSRPRQVALLQQLVAAPRVFGGAHHQPPRHASSIWSRAANGVPSTYSRNAPPPVETCVIFPSSPNASTASAVSPPPTTVTALDAASASAMASVPLRNGSSSNLPIGPFQTTVAAFAISSR